LLGEALKGHRDDVVVATKFGMDAGGANGRDFGVRWLVLMSRSRAASSIFERPAYQWT
jgi:aryl-alcohol dehydrogenase-like predicted oxidoreductase